MWAKQVRHPIHDLGQLLQPGMSVAVEGQVRIVVPGQLHGILHGTATLNDRRDVGMPQTVKIERL